MKKKLSQKTRIRRTLILLIAITALLTLALILLPEQRVIPTADRNQEERDRPSEPEYPQEEQAVTIPAGPPETPLKELRLAVVIDDVGYNLHELDVFLNFPWQITFAVLPGLDYTQEAAARIVTAGKGLILHCPMEPLNGQDPGPGALYSDYSVEELTAVLERNFADLPQAAGMNNHMGSKLSTDPAAMSTVVRYLKQNGKFLLDSRTSPASVIVPEAEKQGLPVLERDVFLDNESDPEYIKRSVLRGVEIAQKQGFAVLIGHVSSPVIVDLFEELMPELIAKGVQLASLEDLLLTE